MLYCNGNSVFIVNVNDVTDVDIYTEHPISTTVAKMSPSGSVIFFYLLKSIFYFFQLLLRIRRQPWQHSSVGHDAENAHSQGCLSGSFYKPRKSVVFNQISMRLFFFHGFFCFSKSKTTYIFQRLPNKLRSRILMNFSFLGILWSRSRHRVERRFEENRCGWRGQGTVKDSFFFAYSNLLLFQLRSRFPVRHGHFER